ncbi:eukaryotic translation initiation factor 3 subunit A-like [Aricia agestis]|uniref:eukaryotic translation initiation factor 3 subunit A-like n=1 Tax=Aricia agestis TaxID=91739 RepID=UPI001C2063FF|nr:eukaryotic translation initiation factor 3 subunit A-like [Aricia agestis]
MSGGDGRSQGGGSRKTKKKGGNVSRSRSRSRSEGGTDSDRNRGKKGVMPSDKAVAGPSTSRLTVSGGITLGEILGDDWTMTSVPVSMSESEPVTRKRLYSERSGSDTEGTDVASGRAKKLPTARRGRGRGTASLLTAARQALTEKEAQKAEDFVSSLERQSFRKSPVKEVTCERPGPLDLDVDQMAADDLMTTAVGRLDDILYIASRSTNLKGGYASQIRRATGVIRSVLETLAMRTEVEETRRLRADNNRLQREVANLKEEVRAYRRDFEEAKKAVAAQRHSMLSEEQLSTLEGSIARMVGNMIDGRLAAIKDRLPPPPIVRPPLAADRKNAAREASGASLAPAPVVREKSPIIGTPRQSAPMEMSSRHREEFPPLPVRPVTRPAPAKAPVEKGKGKGKGKKTKETEWTSFGHSVSKEKSQGRERRTEEVQQFSPQPVPVMAEPQPQSGPAEGWSEVVRRKGAKKPKAKPKEAPKSAPKGKKLTLPNSEAIIVKLRPEAQQSGVSYGEALTKARLAIDPQEFGLGPLRIRNSATGARLIQVPGRTSGDKADKLANKLASVLSDVADISRPVLTACFKLTGLDDTANAASIKAAVAKEGGCALEQVWVGDIFRSFRGNGFARMSCPITAGKELLKRGSLCVGWSRVRVVHEGMRSRHCFRCYELGHSAIMCPSKKDRSELCLRCSQPGHKANTCTSEPHCAACADAGRKANHIMGGKTCNPPSTRGKALPLRPTGREQEAPEAEMSE